MAQREALHLIREARAGQASAQLALGKQYLFGGAGLPKNSATALYWLDRAARQQEEDAWVLIGSYIPFETAHHAENIHTLCFWYELAFQAGILKAGIVFAKLIFAHTSLRSDMVKRTQAIQVLQQVAEAGWVEAQWLLAQHYQGNLPAQEKHGGPTGEEEGWSGECNPEAWRYWAEKAATNGSEAARRSLADHGWEIRDYVLFLKWAELPAEAILQAAAHSAIMINDLSLQDIELLKRYAQALIEVGANDKERIRACWEVAAQAGDAAAQLELGLLLAKMDRNGHRLADTSGRVVYKRALRWLCAAGEQGMSDAWYVASKIYARPEFSRHDAALAQCYLQQAAEAGHVQAQLEWGILLWRKNTGQCDDDVQALKWLCIAADQGCHEAQEWVARIAGASEAQAWATDAGRKLNAQLRRDYPYLTARIELAQHFGLARAEALLLDIAQADRGHCLVIDIRGEHARSRRRLIAIRDKEARQMLDRIRHLFHDVDCSERGVEGNYRRRLYRLKSVMAAQSKQVSAVRGVITRSGLQTPSLPVQSS